MTRIEISQFQAELLRFLQKQLEAAQTNVAITQEKLQIAMSLVCDAHNISPDSKFTIDNFKNELIVGE